MLMAVLWVMRVEGVCEVRSACREGICSEDGFRESVWDSGEWLFLNK